MRVVILSSTHFADTDFPLVKEYQKRDVDVYYLIHLAPHSKRSTLVDIKSQVYTSDIIHASDYKEFNVYKNYIDLSKVYIINSIYSSVKKWENIKLTFKVYKFIKQLNPDVIHILNPLDTTYTILYRYRKKLVLTMHDPFPHSGENNFRKTFFRNVAFKTVNRFVLLNETQREKFQSDYRISDNQLLLNKIGRFDYLDLFNSKNINGNPHDVLFFGRISPYKGIEYLCKAMIKVKEHIPDATLTIAGGGKMYFDITPYENMEWVKIINRYVGMEELACLIGTCALTVCPYTDATQSGVIMTSYSLCKPVVATNVGGLGEMIEDGKTGMLVPPKDVDSLADAIISLLANESLRSNMEKRIKEEYFTGDKSWKVIADKYIEFYNTRL